MTKHHPEYPSIIGLWQVAELILDLLMVRSLWLGIEKR